MAEELEEEEAIKISEALVEKSAFENSYEAAFATLKSISAGRGLLRE